NAARWGARATSAASPVTTWWSFCGIKEKCLANERLGNFTPQAADRAPRRFLQLRRLLRLEVRDAGQRLRASAGQQRRRGIARQQREHPRRADFRHEGCQ